MTFRKVKPYLNEVSLPVPGSIIPQTLILKLNQNGGCDAAVLDRGGKRLEADANCMFTLSLFGQERTVSMEWLILFTFSPLYASRYFAHLLEVKFVNQTNPVDYHPRNLTWVIPDGGVDDPDKPGFKIVPFYSGTSVSAKGEVWSRRLAKLCSVREVQRGGVVYRNTTCTVNSGVSDTVGVHRLMAMAFLRYEGDPFRAAVRYKDGSKAELVPDNLEWSASDTRGANVKRFDRDAIRKALCVRDYVNNEILSFRSVNQAALYLGVNSGIVSTYAASDGKILNDRYELIDLEDLSTGKRVWNVGYFKSNGMDTESPKEIGELDFQRPIAVYTVDSKEAVIFKNHRDAAIRLDVPANEVLARLQRRKKYIVDGTIVCYRDELKALSEWAESSVVLGVRYKDHFNKNGLTTVLYEYRDDGAEPTFEMTRELSDPRNLLKAVLPASNVPAAYEKLRWTGEVVVGKKSFKVLDTTGALSQ